MHRRLVDESLQAYTGTSSWCSWECALTCLLDTYYNICWPLSALASHQLKIFILAYNLRWKFGRMFGTHSVSLPKFLASSSLLNATSVNSFKSQLQKLQSTHIGFFMDMAVSEDAHGHPRSSSWLRWQSSVFIKELIRTWDTRIWRDVSSYLFTYFPLNYDTHVVPEYFSK